jgi:hypothetical protein
MSSLYEFEQSFGLNHWNVDNFVPPAVHHIFSSYSPAMSLPKRNRPGRRALNLNPFLFLCVAVMKSFHHEHSYELTGYCGCREKSRL